MAEQKGQRFLMIYSGGLTAVFAVTVLCGAVLQPRKLELDQLDVHRINIREPDGTLRLVITDKAEFPGAIVHGKEYQHPRPDAGMLFFNDEGTENGGLIFSGHKDKEGNVIDSGGSLTFDQYEQDQLVQLLGIHDKDGHRAGLVVSDRPSRSIQQDFEETKSIDAMPADQRDALLQARDKEAYYGANRITVLRGDDGIAKISLRDGLGRPRIVLGVAEDGASSLQFLDESGKVVNQMTPSAKP
jgi:hypothetical protein